MSQDDQRFAMLHTLCKVWVERGHTLSIRELQTFSDWIQNWCLIWSKPIEDCPVQSAPVLDELHQAILDVLGETARVGCSWMSAADIVRCLFTRRDWCALGYEIERLRPTDIVDAIRCMRKADPNLDDRIEEAGRDGVVDHKLYRLRD